MQPSRNRTHEEDTALIPAGCQGKGVKRRQGCQGFYLEAGKATEGNGNSGGMQAWGLRGEQLTQHQVHRAGRELFL